MIHSCVFLFSDSCSWVPCLSWTVKLPAVLWKNHSGPANSLVFQHFCVYLNTFQQWLYDFEIHHFSPRTTEGLICNYYRRFKHSLMLQMEKSCIKSQGVNTFEQNEDVYFFLVLHKYHIFSFSTALQKLQKIVICFPEDKLSKIYPALQILKVFTPSSQKLVYIYLYKYVYIYIYISAVKWLIAINRIQNKFLYT